MEIVGLDAIKARYIQHCGSDLMVVKAARVSTGNATEEFGDKEKKLIRYLAKNQHFTPFEMCDVTFLFEVPIFIARQVHRHRTASYNEWSGRYSEVGNSFYIPKNFKKQDLINKQGSEGEFTDTENGQLVSLMGYQCIKAFENYQKLLDSGVSKEMARLLLPQNMMTKFYMKMNLRNWMHYCALRCDSHAQYEHQVVATKVFNELLKMFPISVAALARSMFNGETLEKIGIQKEER